MCEFLVNHLLRALARDCFISLLSLLVVERRIDCRIEVTTEVLT